MNSKWVVVAGASGVGKSSAFPVAYSGMDYFVGDSVAAALNNTRGIKIDPKFLIEHNFDELPKEVLESLNYQKIPSEIIKQVNDISEKFIQYHMEQNKSLAYESTLTTKSSLVDAYQAQMNGFDTHLIYVGVNDDGISKERIQNRVEHGGLYIPEQYIEAIRDESLSNLPAATEAFKTVSIYDNSKNFATPEKIMVLQNQQIIYKNEQIPEWVKNSLGVKFDFENNIDANKRDINYAEVDKNPLKNELAKELNYRDYKQMVTFSEELSKTRHGISFYATQNLAAKEVHVWNDHSCKPFVQYKSWKEYKIGLRTREFEEQFKKEFSKIQESFRSKEFGRGM